MPIKYVILWFGAIGIIPTFLYLVLPKEEAKSIVTDKAKMFCVLLITFYVFVTFGIILKMYLNILYIPANIKFQLIAFIVGNGHTTFHHYDTTLNFGAFKTVLSDTLRGRSFIIEAFICNSHKLKSLANDLLTQTMIDDFDGDGLQVFAVLSKATIIVRRWYRYRY